MPTVPGNTITTREVGADSHAQSIQIKKVHSECIIAQEDTICGLEDLPGQLQRCGSRKSTAASASAMQRSQSPQLSEPSRPAPPLQKPSWQFPTSISTAIQTFMAPMTHSTQRLDQECCLVAMTSALDCADINAFGTQPLVLRLLINYRDEWFAQSRVHGSWGLMGRGSAESRPRAWSRLYLVIEGTPCVLCFKSKVAARPQCCCNSCAHCQQPKQSSAGIHIPRPVRQQTSQGTV